MQTRTRQSLGLVTLVVVALLNAGAWATISPPNGGNQIIAHTGQESPPLNSHTGQERDDDGPGNGEPDPGDVDIPLLEFGFNQLPLDISLGLLSPSPSSSRPPQELPRLPLHDAVPILAPLDGLNGPSFGGTVPGGLRAPSVTPIPAPGALVLLGLAGLLNHRRRRRRRR